MRIQELTLKNFRCFADQTFTFGAPLVLLCGPNGSGKTTILEGIHYLCYLRSFRTHTPHDLMLFDTGSLFVRAHIIDATTTYDIQVGVTGKKRVVKIDQRPVQSYRDLMIYYRIVTITQDDLNLVVGEPVYRRSFLDQAITMHNPAYLATSQTYRQILEQRTALLQGNDLRTYDSWTISFWESACAIQEARITYLARLEERINQVIATLQPDLHITLEYTPKHSLGENASAFIAHNQRLRTLETHYRRTLFGPHLDDVHIIFKNKQSRLYASRGQQRLLACLLRIAHAQLLEQSYGSVILLLDDIMTDFDPTVLEWLFSLIATFQGQRIFTAPYSTGTGVSLLENHGALVQYIIR